MGVINALLEKKEELGENEFEAYVKLICFEMGKSLDLHDWSLFFDLKDFLDSELDDELTHD